MSGRHTQPCRRPGLGERIFIGKTWNRGFLGIAPACAAFVLCEPGPTELAAKEDAMKLTTAQIQHATPQIEAQPIPDNHPAVQELKGLFGDHTFFLGRSGLHIVETGEPTRTSALANVVNLASWANEERTALTPHQPEVTDVVVEIGPEEETS
jgi:hypothetical protein